jgi:ubiquinone/menaquinone biosynthesis C-methylase UbiE
MDQHMNAWHFWFMWLGFRIRDLFRPPEAILEGIGIGPGLSVLDYGCGPGSYSIAAARRVGSTGWVYALDILPLAVRRVEKMASRKGLTKIEAICSNCATKLPEACIDVVLFYDTLHALEHPEDVLKELHRVLRPGGTLSVSDHHLENHQIKEVVTRDGLFRLREEGRVRGKRISSFGKVADAANPERRGQDDPEGLGGRDRWTA